MHALLPESRLEMTTTPLEEFEEMPLAMSASQLGT